MDRSAAIEKAILEGLKANPDTKSMVPEDPTGLVTAKYVADGSGFPYYSITISRIVDPEISFAGS